jgi:hypothetical protein
LANKIQFPVGSQFGVKLPCALTFKKVVKNKKRKSTLERQIFGFMRALKANACY